LAGFVNIPADRRVRLGFEGLIKIPIGKAQISVMSYGCGKQSERENSTPGLLTSLFLYFSPLKMTSNSLHITTALENTLGN
jgi:hypothetical protein